MKRWIERVAFFSLGRANRPVLNLLLRLLMGRTVRAMTDRLYAVEVRDTL